MRKLGFILMCKIYLLEICTIIGVPLFFQSSKNEEVAVAMGYDNLFFPSAFLVLGAAVAVVMMVTELVWSFLRGGPKVTRGRTKILLLKKTKTSPNRRLTFLRSNGNLH